MKQMIEIVDVVGREILDSRGNPCLLYTSVKQECPFQISFINAASFWGAELPQA